MARRRVRGRAGVSRQDALVSRTAGRRKATPGSSNGSMIPGAVWDVVKTVETGAAGAVRIGQDVLGGTVSRARTLGSDALSVIGAGARGVVSLSSRMVESVVGTAQGLYQDALASAKQAPARTRRPRPA